ncbi:MAG: hypothetical protein ACOC56_05410 [Atribacterota bacterium]
MIEWIILIILFALLIIRIRVKRRGYFWKAKDGSELTFKEFLSQWKKGIEGITPLQQKKTALWAFLPLFAGIVWGIAVTLISGVYWLTAILFGSLPLTTINFISTLQQYWAIKRVEEVMKDVKK